MVFQRGMAPDFNSASGGPDVAAAADLFDPASLFDAVFERLSGVVAPQNPLSATPARSLVDMGPKTATTPSASAAFNTSALRASLSFKEPATKIDPTRAIAPGSPQSVKDINNDAQKRLATADAAKHQLAALQDNAAKTAGPSGGGAGNLLKTAMDTVLPGSGLVIGMASRVLAGQGTLATANAPTSYLSESFNRKGAPKSGYAASAAAPSPVDIMKAERAAPSASPQSQAVLSQMGSGPGFGRAPASVFDTGRSTLAGDSLRDMKIGGLSMADYGRHLDHLQYDAKAAKGLITQQQDKGLPFTVENVDRTLRSGMKIDITKPNLMAASL